MSMNQSNMDLIASGTVVYPDAGEPVLVSQNGRVKSIARTTGKAFGSIDITLQADEGVAGSNYGIDPTLDPNVVPLVPGSDSALVCSYNNYFGGTPANVAAVDISPTADPTVWRVQSVTSGANPALADWNFSFQISRKRSV